MTIENAQGCQDRAIFSIDAQILACDGVEKTFNVENTQGDRCYKWEPESLFGTGEAALGTEQAITITEDVTIIVHESDDQGNYYGAFEINAIANSNQTISIHSDPSKVCDGQPITLVASEGFNNYEWRIVLK